MTLLVGLSCLRLWSLSSFGSIRVANKAETPSGISAACVIGLLLSATYASFQWTVGKLWWETASAGLLLHDFGTNQPEGRVPVQSNSWSVCAALLLGECDLRGHNLTSPSGKLGEKLRNRKPLEMACAAWALSVLREEKGWGCAGLTYRSQLNGLLTIGEVKATWLILPVVIRSSQRLSHACLSINILLWNCERLIISVIVYLIVPYYLDTRSNSRANTCINTQLFADG